MCPHIHAAQQCTHNAFCSHLNSNGPFSIKCCIRHGGIARLVCVNILNDIRNGITVIRNLNLI